MGNEPTNSSQLFIQACIATSTKPFVKDLNLSAAKLSNERYFLSGKSKSENLMFVPGRVYYEGELTNDEPQGKGLIRWNKDSLEVANCPYYEGEFHNGSAHGSGKYMSQEFIFIGRWDSGKPVEGFMEVFTHHSQKFVYKVEKIAYTESPDECSAKLTIPGGSMYEGDLKKIRGYYRYHGKGTMLFPNGDKYKGEWLEGRMHGNGSYTWKESGRIYEGMYNGGLKEGRGRLWMRDNIWLEGEWRDGMKEGKFELVERMPGVNPKVLSHEMFDKDVCLQYCTE